MLLLNVQILSTLSYGIWRARKEIKDKDMWEGRKKRRRDEGGKGTVYKGLLRKERGGDSRGNTVRKELGRRKRRGREVKSEGQDRGKMSGSRGPYFGSEKDIPSFPKMIFFLLLR